MAEKRRFLDVWIIESNTVYREVPFSVVIDWIQQGRLLPDDQLRWSGQKDWFKLGGVPAFTAYLPQADFTRADDRAEALERVELDFSYKPAASEEDEDVDMIPLIDVSLVLLIFFIMTASTAAGAFILMPPAHQFDQTKDPWMYWIGINFQPEDRSVYYLLGRGTESQATPYKSQTELMDAFRKILATTERRAVEVQIKAHQDLQEGIISDLLVALESNPETKSKIAKYHTGVR